MADVEKLTIDLNTETNNIETSLENLQKALNIVHKLVAEDGLKLRKRFGGFKAFCVTGRKEGINMLAKHERRRYNEVKERGKCDLSLL